MRMIMLALALAWTGAEANAIYHYEGVDLSQHPPSNGIPADVTHLSGDIVFDAALAPDLSSALVPVLDFSFSDGASVANAGDVYVIATGTNGGRAQFSTDSSGNITDWGFIIVYSPYPYQMHVGLAELTSVGHAGDSTNYCLQVDAVSGSCTLGAFAVSPSPGVWTPVPIPAIGWLLAPAFGTLGWMRRRAAS